MPAKRFSFDDAGGLTGGDIENLRDEEHPGGDLGEDIEGSGIDNPDLDEAEWDIEIEDEDRDDPRWKNINLPDLTPVDREAYLTFLSLRRGVNEFLAGAVGGGVDSLKRDVAQFSAQLENPEDNASRVNFY